MKKAIVYFSWSNNTKELVESFNKKIDTFRIERLIPYSKDYDKVVYVESKNEYDEKAYPEIKPINSDFSSYDVIFLFYPIWWKTIPRVVATFVKNLQFDKEVVVFCQSYTNDKANMVISFSDIKRVNKKIKFKQGLFNANSIMIKEFINQYEEKMEKKLNKKVK